MRASTAALAAVLALAAAGCGGSSSPPPPATTAAGGGLTPQEQRGKAVFVSQCGSCHALADAGTSGIAGPDLDEHPWRAVTVGEVIASGPGLMPAGIVAGADADAVAAYVAAATHR